MQPNACGMVTLELERRARKVFRAVMSGNEIPMCKDTIYDSQINGKTNFVSNQLFIRFSLNIIHKHITNVILTNLCNARVFEKRVLDLTLHFMSANFVTSEISVYSGSFLYVAVNFAIFGLISVY